MPRLTRRWVSLLSLLGAAGGLVTAAPADAQLLWSYASIHLKAGDRDYHENGKYSRRESRPERFTRAGRRYRVTVIQRARPLLAPVAQQGK